MECRDIRLGKVCRERCPRYDWCKNCMENLPVSAARDVGEKYELSRVILIAVDDKANMTYTVSWGDTKENCGFAAMDIQKLRAVLESHPTSLEDAIAVAKRVRPNDVEGM